MNTQAPIDVHPLGSDGRWDKPQPRGGICLSAWRDYNEKTMIPITGASGIQKFGH